MHQYFVDTWFLIAELHRLDAHHRKAHRLRASLVNARFVTHDAILTEFLTFFAEEGAHWRGRAVQVVRRIALDRTFKIFPADRPLFLAALDRYAARPDKGYSLVDCMSMALMERRGITHVLTNDHHFRQEGFVVVNDAP
jgi:predicted nucleic acid-binding protein